MLDARLRYYNERRPKEGLGWLSPMEHGEKLGLAAWPVQEKVRIPLPKGLGSGTYEQSVSVQWAEFKETLSNGWLAEPIWFRSRFSRAWRPRRAPCGALLPLRAAPVGEVEPQLHLSLRPLENGS